MSAVSFKFFSFITFKIPFLLFALAIDEFISLMSPMLLFIYSFWLYTLQLVNGAFRPVISGVTADVQGYLLVHWAQSEMIEPILVV